MRAKIGRLRFASQSSQSSLFRLLLEEEEREERPITWQKGKMRETGEEASE